MTEKTTYEQKGTLRDDCMKDTAMPDGFRPLESDWRELLRWLMSVSGNLPYHDPTDKENGPLSALWENHVLTVLVDILQKDVCDYVNSFVDGRGTSAQTEYTHDLKDKFTGWVCRLRKYIDRSRSLATTESPAVEVAIQLLEQLEKAVPQNTEPRPKTFFTPLNDMNRPYYGMLGTVADIQQKGGEYITRIEQSGDMDASLALLLTFVRNYCGIAERFNARFGGWAEFYRRNILHDTPKAAVQDSTLIVIAPDRKKIAETFPLPNGTEFTAGKKADGSDLCYATTEKAYIVPAHIHAAYALFGKDCCLYITPLLNKEQESTCSLFDGTNPAAKALEYGWLIASRSLVLSEGRCTVTVSFLLATLKDTPTPDFPAYTEGTKPFILQISGSEGWVQTAYTPDYGKDTRLLRLTFTLNEGDEAPTACTDELHGIATGYPALRILFADRGLPQTLHIESITLATEVTGIRDFTLIGESGQIDPSQPFYPFGPTGERDSRLIFGHEEAALKEITAVTLNGAWTKLPENGFGTIYRNYDTGQPIDEKSFLVRCQWQENSHWHECPGSPQPLFHKDGEGKLAEETAFEFVLTETNMATNGPMPYRRDSNGFYRLTLAAPDMGFGMNAYYRLFSEVMMHNGREKEKNWKPVPEQPQVPMLGDVTFGYRSEESIRSGDGCLYRFTEINGYEECLASYEPAPAFLPEMEYPSLLVGLDNMGDTNRVRLYLDLCYVVQGWKPVREQSGCTLAIGIYMGNGIWKRVPEEDVLCEETDGLTRSGFIEIKASEKEKGNGLWLRFAFKDGKVPDGTIVNGIYLNCFRVTAEGGDGNALPAGTIQAPAIEDSRILSVTQPMPGSGGKPAETEADTGVRQRIRISSRNRAVCGSNYEEMVLERFPEIEKACCIPAAAEDGGVHIVVFSKPEKRKYPFLPGWKLSEIERFIREYAPPFATIHAFNPLYEPLKISFKAVLKPDTRDPGSVKRRTERRIRVFFMAWYMDGRLPDLGVQYSCDALLSRIVNDECIADFISLDITTGDRTHRITGEGGRDELILSAASGYGVLYVEELDVELVNGRSGVDEARIGTDFVIR